MQGMGGFSNCAHYNMSQTTTVTQAKHPIFCKFCKHNFRLTIGFSRFWHTYIHTHTYTHTHHKFLHKLDPVDWIRCRLIPFTGSGKLDPLHWIRSAGTVRNWIRSTTTFWIRSKLDPFNGKLDPVRLPKIVFGSGAESIYLDLNCRKSVLIP